MTARFNIQAADPAAVSILRKTLHLPNFIAATLVSRGIDNPKLAREFMDPQLDRDWANPYEVAGLREVVDGLEAAVRANKRLLVFGDFDLDGISATTVLTRGLRALGAQAIPFVPFRDKEGYGLSDAAIERLMVHEPDVVVTVDCGIACRDEVKTLQHRGVEVFITDHHEPAELVPQDVPVCDPKLEEDSPEGILAGVGVALKVVQALGARFGQPHLWREYTDFATLGTIADLMPMLRDNRALVADGVRRMNEAPRPCIAALLASSKQAGKPVASTSLSFSVIPRLNAAGRMSDAQLALDLLLSDDFDEASRLAKELEHLNDKRRAIEAELVEIATLQAQEVYHGQRALVVSGVGWHEGVKGIVASRLVRTYGVPTILFSIDEETGEARGSGRSVGEVNLFKAVESASDLLVRFGGHEAAVGVTIKTDRLQEFADRLCAYMDGLPEDSFHPSIPIDAEVDLGELTMENVEKLDALAPFGQKNRQPRFLVRDVLLKKTRAVGAEKNHFSCLLTDGRNKIAGIMFHCPDIDELMKCGGVVYASFEAQIDEWRGHRSVKAMLDTIVPVRPCAALEACLEPEHVSFVADLFGTSDAELCADCCESAADIEAYEAAREQNRAMWEERARRDAQGLSRAIMQAFIGEEGSLFPAQADVLDALGEGKSTLAVMATGRGKSLLFQMHAALLALRDGKASLIVYPLRALIADQAFHLREALDRFGIAVEVLTGESTPAERRRIFDALAQGAADIVLTTPEFLGYHEREFAATGRIGFLVVDEAHHIGMARTGGREGYAQMARRLDALGRPLVLALTATAPEDVAADVRGALDVRCQVLDPTDRPNIHLDDQRNLKRRDTYLATIVATGDKTVIYVNSREHSVALARSLRNLVPQMASMIGFYNAGLSRAERQQVEEMFRADSLRVLVATSAFGEGVNIPNVRRVVLYHMPFNDVEFNQMSGRVGRDGRDAWVHLLFGRADAIVNERILESATPGHDTMAQVYRQLRAMQRASAERFFATSDADLAARCTAAQPAFPVSADSTACAVAVFRELGLIETRSSRVEGETQRLVSVLEDTSRVELIDSARYREGLDERDIFRNFRDWVMSSTSDELKQRICRPILPDAGWAASGGCER